MNGGRWKISKRNFNSVIITAAIIAVVGSVILGSREHVQQDFGVVLSFSANIALFAALFIRSVRRHTYSFDMMMWLFSLFFFGFAPLLQYFTGVYAWGLKPTQAELIRTNLFILLFSVCFCIGKGLKRGRSHLSSTQDLKVKRDRLRILLVLSGLVAVYHLRFIGFRNLLISATNFNEDLNSTMGLLVTHVFKNIALFTAVMYMMKCKEQRKIDIEAVLAFVFLLISCFPTGLSRNMMGSFYGGLFLLAFDRKREKRWITYAIIFGLILVFPAANVFRNAATMSGGSISELILRNIQNTYLEAHYDAHQMFISIQQYVEKYGFSYGYQLLGALLFFVPRSIWPTKPYGTGRMAFEALSQYWFTNVSAPLVSEGYSNFGVVGVIGFGLIVGLLVNQLDNRFWKDDRNVSATKILYPFIMLKFFFMLRGDLLSSWAYMFAQVVVGYLIIRFSTKRVNA